MITAASTNITDITSLLTPETLVIIFTIVGALVTSLIEIRKKKKLNQLSNSDDEKDPLYNYWAADSALDLAKEALRQVEKAANDCNEKFDELSDKYDRLEEKYFNQIEINTTQSEMITRLNIELLHFKNALNIPETNVEVDDKDTD